MRITSEPAGSSDTFVLRATPTSVLLTSPPANAPDYGSVGTPHCYTCFTSERGVLGNLLGLLFGCESVRTMCAVSASQVRGTAV